MAFPAAESSSSIMMPMSKIRLPCLLIERTQMTVRARIPSKGETALRFLNEIEISAMNGSRCICKSHCRTGGLTSQLEGCWRGIARYRIAHRSEWTISHVIIAGWIEALRTAVYGRLRAKINEARKKLDDISPRKLAEYNYKTRASYLFRSLSF